MEIKGRSCKSDERKRREKGEGVDREQRRKRTNNLLPRQERWIDRWMDGWMDG